MTKKNPPSPRGWRAFRIGAVIASPLYRPEIMHRTAADDKGFRLAVYPSQVSRSKIGEGTAMSALERGAIAPLDPSSPL